MSPGGLLSMGTAEAVFMADVDGELFGAAGEDFAEGPLADVRVLEVALDLVPALGVDEPPHAATPANAASDTARTITCLHLGIDGFDILTACTPLNEITMRASAASSQARRQGRHPQRASSP